jgi:hypothetical protein
MEIKYIVTKHLLLVTLIALLLTMTGCQMNNDKLDSNRIEDNSSKAIAANITFNALAPNTFVVGNTFILQGVKMTVLPYKAPGSPPYFGGTVTSQATNNAGGTGIELQINNANVGFDFCGTVGSVTLRFCYQGGRCCLQINNAYRNIPFFTAYLPPPGVAVTVGGVCAGALSATGTINTVPFAPIPTLGNYTFVIGGQELYIDDVISAL